MTKLTFIGPRGDTIIERIRNQSKANLASTAKLMQSEVPDILAMHTPQKTGRTAKGWRVNVRSEENRITLGLTNDHIAEGKDKIPVVNIIDNTTEPEKTHTTGSAGRYVPAIGKRLIEGGKKLTTGVGEQAAREWARKNGLKFPIKRPRVVQVGDLGEHGYGAMIVEKSKDLLPDLYDITTGKRVKAEVGDMVLSTLDVIEKKEPKGKLDVSKPSAGPRFSLGVPEHKEYTHVPMSQAEYTRTTFHEYLHYIIDYNQQYGTPQQKKRVKELIDAGYLMLDTLADIPEKYDEHSAGYYEEIYVERITSAVDKYKWDRAVNQLRRKKWTVDIVGGDYDTGADPGAYLAELQDLVEDPEDQVIMYVGLQHPEYGAADVTVLQNRRTGEKRGHVDWTESYHRGKGYGRKVYSAAKSVLRASGMEKVTLESVESAKGFWKKMGFRDERRHGRSIRPFPMIGGGAQGLEMATHLRIGWHPGSLRVPIVGNSLPEIRQLFHKSAKSIFKEKVTKEKEEKVWSTVWRRWPNR